MGQTMSLATLNTLWREIAALLLHCGCYCNCQHRHSLPNNDYGQQGQSSFESQKLGSRSAATAVNTTACYHFTWRQLLVPFHCQCCCFCYGWC